MKNKIILLLIILSLFITAASAGTVIKSNIIKDDTAKKSKIITNVPAELKNKIAIAGGDTSYSVTKTSSGIKISKAEAKDTHTKTVCCMDISAIQALPGYNGKEFSVMRMVDGKVIDFRILKTKDVLKGKTVTFDVMFSEVIVSGMTGTYTKTVSINTLNTTIPFAVTGATALNVLIDSPGTYTAFNESNIATYPDPSHWLLVWPLNGNANDISGNGRNGAITAATSVAGRSGASATGYYFDGDNDYISYNYSDTLYTANTLLFGYKLNHTVSDSNHIIADYRNPAGSGRTGMYEYENTYYVNNATSTTTLNSTTNQGWKYAFYPFTPAQINYIWIGVRYTLTFDYKGWIDCIGLYNGTLSADQRRVFSYGYQGITVAPYPTTTRTPILSSNQSVTPPSTVTGVNVKSPTSTTKTVTLVAYLQQNATLVREWDNSTHHNVDIRFTAGSNITSGTIAYEMLSADGMGAPSLSTNESGATVELVNTTLYIDFTNLTSGQTRYFNTSLPVGSVAIYDYSPDEFTQTIGIGENIEFELFANGTTDFFWYVNNSMEHADADSVYGDFTYTGTVPGNYSIKGQIEDINGDSRTWILTVLPDPVVSISPDDTDFKIRNDSIQQFKVTYSYPQTVTWLQNNVSMRNDSDVLVTAYWMNASDIGIYNVTARIGATQRMWTVNVTSNPNPGAGAFVDDAAIAVVVVVAASYFWNRFRRRTF